VKVGDLIKQLKSFDEDMEVIMQATTLFNNDETIFDSTVETLIEQDGQLKLYWQI